MLSSRPAAHAGSSEVVEKVSRERELCRTGDDAVSFKFSALLTTTSSLLADRGSGLRR